MLIPIVEQGDGSFRCTYQGEELRLRNRQEVDESTNKVADSGSYSRIMARSRALRHQREGPHWTCGPVDQRKRSADEDEVLACNLVQVGQAFEEGYALL